MTLPYGAPFITFGIGWPFGPWMDYDCDWGGGNLIFWGNGYSRPANWWHESSRQRDMGHTGVWRANYHPGAVAANRGDRGYGGNTLSRAATPAAIRQELAHPVAQQAEHSINSSGPAPAPAGRSMNFAVFPDPRPLQLNTPQPVSRPESNGAFIGIQSSQDTRTYSNRGQQSMQTVTRSAPVSRPAPASRRHQAMFWRWRRWRWGGGMVVGKSLIFIPMIFKKIISDENKLVHRVAADARWRPVGLGLMLPLCVSRLKRTDFQFAAGCRQRLGGGGQNHDTNAMHSIFGAGRT
jgi:hypothetical protein